MGKRRGLNEPPRALATWRQTLKLRGVGALAGLTGAAPDLIALFVFGTLPNMPPNGGANVSQSVCQSVSRAVKGQVATARSVRVEALKVARK